MLDQLWTLCRNTRLSKKHTLKFYCARLYLICPNRIDPNLPIVAIATYNDNGVFWFKDRKDKFKVLPNNGMPAPAEGNGQFGYSTDAGDADPGQPARFEFHKC